MRDEKQTTDRATIEGCEYVILPREEYEQPAAAREIAKGMRRYEGSGGAQRAVEALDALAGAGGALCREAGPKTVRYRVRRAPPNGGVGACGSDDPADRASADAEGQEVEP